MDSARLLDSRLALVAGTALTTAAACFASTYLARGASNSSAASPDETKSDDEDKEEEDGKRYETKKEYYSPVTGTWETRDEDDDDKTKFLFVVKHRSWPKSQDYAGHEDYTALEIASQPLIDLLRLVLKEVEDVFEDEPSLDAQDLFLHLPQLKELLKTKKEQKERLEKEDEGKAEKEDEDESKEGEEQGAESVEKDKESSEASAEASTSAVTITTEKDEEKAEDLKTTPPQTLEEVTAEVEHFTVLLEYIEELFAPTQAKLERLLKDGNISFNLLWAIFTPESHVVITDSVSGEKQAFKLKSCSYCMSRDGPVFELNGTKILWNGTRYSRTWIDASIPKFKGLRSVSSLPAHPLGDKMREELTVRGRSYCDLAGVRFLDYTGVLIQVIGCGMDRRIVKLRAEGRAVVDTKSYRRMNPSRASQSMWDDEEDEFDLEDGSGPVVGEVPSDDELCLLGPTVYGFSLVCREWGELMVHLFKPIKFSSTAYDHLVLDQDYKDLVRSLVQQNSTLSKARAVERNSTEVSKTTKPLEDVIGGKGGGLIAVLHGRPGVGKTLTAEAVSELLEAPLYSVTAGELGVQADQLEKRLRDALDVAQSWGAVLLIDEADVFLEQRSLHDVQRNAMVSVFLRVLEYHSGVLFLTTNRIRTVDEAFLSRFSIAITYPDLDKAKRRTIWASFLRLAGVGIEGETAPKKKLANGLATPDSKPSSPEPTEGEPEFKSTVSAKYLDRLASKPGFNGRSIKNTVRTAQALAMSKNSPLTSVEIDVVVKTSEKFAEDFKEADEAGVYDASGEGWKDRTSVYN